MTELIDFRTAWKELAHNKAIQAHHMIQLCVVRALKAKSPNKKEIAIAFIKEAFTPKRYASGRIPYDIVGWNIASAKIYREVRIYNTAKKKFEAKDSFILFNRDSNEILTKDEIEEFDNLLKEINVKVIRQSIKNYVFTFVRQDMTPEQQLVQAAHVNLKLGQNLPKGHNPDKLYFTVIGIPNGEELASVIEWLAIKGHIFETFEEPDMKDDYKITAVAMFPIFEYAKGHLKHFKTLRF